MTPRPRPLCETYDPETFFPVGTSGPAVLQIEQAKAICADCPVKPNCLQYAIDHGIDEGIWGGTTPDQRKHMRRGIDREVNLNERTRLFAVVA